MPSSLGLLAIACPSQFRDSYWDANWDADNPSMTKQQLDNFVTALLQSSYFGGTAEYRHTIPLIRRRILARPGCPQQAPPSVGFFDSNGPSIMGFLDCELRQGGIPQHSQVVYNIILPVRLDRERFFRR